MLSLFTAVALICAGDDPAHAATLQRSLEPKLTTAGLRLVTSEALARSLATLDPVLRQPVVDAVLKQTADTLLEDARRAYYDGRFDESAAKLAALSAFLDGATSLPSSARVELLLWRAALFLESGDAGAAGIPVRDALTLAPDVLVSDASFPPSLVALVRQFQSQPAPRITLRFAQLPEGASVFVDDRPVTTRGADGAPFASVPAGKHRITATAPGREFARVVVDARAAAVLTLSLPLALPASARAVLATVPTGTAKDGPPPDELRSLARSLGADDLVLVGRTAAGFFALATRGSRMHVLVPTSAKTEAALVAWILERLPARNAIGLDVTAASHLALRTREVVGGWSGAFGGAGVSLGVSKRFGESVTVLAEGRATSWVLSSVTVEGADGERSDGGGGQSFGGRAAALYDRGRFSLGLGLTLDDLRSEDVGDLGLFPSQRRVSGELLAGWRGSLRGGWNARVDAALSPYAWIAESPAGTTGKTGTGEPSGGLTLSADRPLGAWRLGGFLSGAVHRSRFQGLSNTATEPALRDAHTSETTAALGLRMGRSF